MDAHLARWALLAAAFFSLGAGYRTANFVVEAPTTQISQQIGDAAEKYRRELAIEWLGKEMPKWSQPCPITAQVAEHLGAGGATSFVFDHGEVFGWRMTIQGSLVRVLDSVLPHEVTHTVFATHFRQPLPRWADEGACTTVEHASERSKQQTMLVDQLRTNRGIAFSRMFAMRDYPHDVMPLYSQGYSVARYLIAQGGKHKFLDYIGDGLRDENWTRATQKYYGVGSLAMLQNNWLDWVRKGSSALDVPAVGATLVAANSETPARRVRPEGDLLHRGGDSAAVRVAMPGPTEDSPRESVYELASTSRAVGGAKLQPRTDSWHKPQPRPVADNETLTTVEVTPPGPTEGPQPVTRQATRPQPAQGARQVILEWSRNTPVEETAGYGR